MDDATKLRIDELVFKSLEGIISREEQTELSSLLNSDPQALGYYASGIHFNLGMQKMCSCVKPQTLPQDRILSFNQGEQMSNEEYLELFHQLVQEERDAPKVRHEEKPELIRKVVYPPREKRKLSTLKKILLIMNVAAVFFLLLMVKYAPANGGVEVALLADQINVNWADSAVHLSNGDRLCTNQNPLILEKGIISVQYDDGVSLVIEGPAEFTVERSGIYLQYGRLFSRVSDTGLGFSVDTPNSRFVDLGTEFGVEADINGSSELHVMKGQVQLFAGAKMDAKSCSIVTKNNAARFDARSGEVKQVRFEEKAFVRKIDSSVNMVWRGQGKIELNDIVGGGNGFGTGILDAGIDTNSGLFFSAPQPDLLRGEITGAVKGGGGYNEVGSLAMIDGVFVPDSSKGPVQITSAGHKFEQFTDGGNSFWGNIFNGAWHVSSSCVKHNLRLDGIAYGSNEHPAISMHSNQGITFDLQAIRSAIPGGKLLQFTSIFGVSETIALDSYFIQGTAGSGLGKVNCWVLIDGKVMFNMNDVSYRQGAIDIEVDIRDEDRFLTLVVTEAGDRRGYDCSLFAEPELTIEMNTN
ncbi:MAG: NPCBM/NEW2 domain-containing protein [Phycisphaerae bacterium]